MSSRTWVGWACLLAFCYCHKIPFKVKSAIHIALHCHVWGDTTYKAAKSNMEPEKAKLSRIPCLARERESIGENRESFEPCLGFCITLCSYGCCHTSKWLITRSQWQAAATPHYLIAIHMGWNTYQKACSPKQIRKKTLVKTNSLTKAPRKGKIALIFWGYMQWENSYVFGFGSYDLLWKWYGTFCQHDALNSSVLENAA